MHLEDELSALACSMGVSLHGDLMTRCGSDALSEEGLSDCQDWCCVEVEMFLPRGRS